MTVEELIEKLKSFPPQAEVHIYEHLYGMYGPSNKMVSPQLRMAYKTSYYHIVPADGSYEGPTVQDTERWTPREVVFL